MNTKKRNLGFVRVLGTVLLVALVLTTSIWLTRAQLAKQSGVNTASVYSGGYLNSIPTKSNALEPALKTTEPRPEIKCKIYASDTNRVDPKKHPTIDKMLKTDSGYCGVYSYLLSLYHIFGIREITTKAGKMPIADPENKKNMNLNLIEQYVKNIPSLRDGTFKTEIIDLYKLAGKKCVEVEYNEEKVDSQCKDLKAYKDAGYDCNLGVYGDVSGHAVNVKSVYWDKKKKACVHEVYHTGNQEDPKIKPDLHTVNILPAEKGYYPKVGYPEDDVVYNQGANYICCK